MGFPCSLYIGKKGGGGEGGYLLFLNYVHMAKQWATFVPEETEGFRDLTIHDITESTQTSELYYVYMMSA